MYYTIYKITNRINKKYYIGKHQTKDLNDGYMGSGKLICQAIEKYGLENFTKEILFVFDNEEEMNNKEKELVIVSEETYNLCEGGKGGFGYINSSGIEKFKGKKHNKETKQKIRNSRLGKTNYIPTEEYKKKISESLKHKHKISKGFNNTGPRSEETKRKMSDSHKGKIHSDEAKRKMKDAWAKRKAALV